jgi:hypothetical protein
LTSEATGSALYYSSAIAVHIGKVNKYYKDFLKLEKADWMSSYE